MPGQDGIGIKDLYIAIGHLEITETDLQTIGHIKEKQEYKVMEHMGTSIPSFEGGIRYIFKY